MMKLYINLILICYQTVLTKIDESSMFYDYLWRVRIILPCHTNSTLVQSTTPKCIQDGNIIEEINSKYWRSYTNIKDAHIYYQNWVDVQNDFIYIFT